MKKRKRLGAGVGDLSLVVSSSRPEKRKRGRPREGKPETEARSFRVEADLLEELAVAAVLNREGVGQFVSNAIRERIARLVKAWGKPLPTRKR